MHARCARLLLTLPLLIGSGAAHATPADAYAAMLAYLTHSRVDGNALHGSSGAIGVNLAAGDHNQQANLRVLAVGAQAATHIRAQQRQTDNAVQAPDVASASIGGRALDHASGLVSINQASGTLNTQLNTASVALAQPGIREASTAQWFADVCACAQQATSTEPGALESRPRTRAAAVENGALHGVHGVVQLNQIAGSNNVTANHLSIDMGVTPR